MGSGTSLRISPPPLLLSTGEEAMRTAARLKVGAQPATFSAGGQPWTLRPNTVYTARGWLLLKVDTSWAAPKVLFMEDDRLYEWSASDFVRTIGFDAMGRGAQKAMGMVTLAEWEAGLLTGALVPWYTTLLVSAAGLALFFHNNRALVESAIAQARVVKQLLDALETRAPTLFKVLIGDFWRRAFRGLWKPGFTTDDLLSFLPGLLAVFVEIKYKIGAREMPEGKRARRREIAQRIRLAAAGLGKFLLEELASDLPTFLTEGATGSVTDFAGSLIQGGYRMSNEERRAVEKELRAWGLQNAREHLKQLRAASRTLLPTLEKLADELESQGVL